MKEFTYTIKDEQGIHARPAGELVKAAAAYPCKVTISKESLELWVLVLNADRKLY